MIKITFIATLAYNYFFPGKVRQAGGHTRIYNLARKLAEKPEFEVSCVVGDFGQPAVVVKDGVRLIKAPIDSPVSFFNVLYILWRLNSDVYIDFIASPRLLLLYILRMINKSKYIFLTGSENDVNNRYGEVENALFGRAYVFGLKRSDAVISQVPRHVEMLKRNFGIESQLVLSPYFDIQAYEPCEKNTILWVGRAATYKRPEIFVDIVKSFLKYKFVMICNESPYDNDFMNSIKKRLPSLPNLTFHDYVTYPEMERYYKEAKLLVNTSDYEGFPNTFIEAAIHYTPIVSLNSDPNGMFSIHSCGICCNGIFQKMANAIEAIAASEEIQKRFGENAFNYAKQNHQLTDAVAKFDLIIQDVLNRR